jgi:hypothetical protein
MEYLDMFRDLKHLEFIFIPGTNLFSIIRFPWVFGLIEYLVLLNVDPKSYYPGPGFFLFTPPRIPVCHIFYYIIK